MVTRRALIASGAAGLLAEELGRTTRLRGRGTGALKLH